MNVTIKKQKMYLLAAVLFVAGSCSAMPATGQGMVLLSSSGRSGSLNPNTIILPKLSRTHGVFERAMDVSSDPIGTVLPDGSIYEGMVSGTNFNSDFRAGAPAGTPTNSISSLSVTAQGTGPNGAINQVLVNQAWSPNAVQGWEDKIRLDTTAFSNGTLIYLIFRKTGYPYNGTLEVPSDNKYAWLVNNQLFSGGNTNFMFQSELVDEVSFALSRQNYDYDASLTDDAAAIEGEITKSTVFFISTHGLADQMGDCLAVPGTALNPDDEDYLYAFNIATAAAAKPSRTQYDPYPFQFVFVDACQTFSDDDVAHAFMAGSVSVVHPPVIPGSDTGVAAMGWDKFVISSSFSGTSDDVGFSEDLFTHLASGCTLGKSIEWSLHDNPVQGTTYATDPPGGVGVVPLGPTNPLLPLYPQFYGDGFMTLHGVYKGNQPVSTWWKLIYNNTYPDPVSGPNG